MRVLVIGDIHGPATHKRYLDFCRGIYRDWNCNYVVFIGDIIDHHAISFHSHNSRCPNADEEYNIALGCIQKWYQAFPKATVTIGNHDERPTRLAESVNIPPVYLRNYSEVWNTKGWKWVENTIIDNVYYSHSSGSASRSPALNAASARMMSTVSGHAHNVAGIHWQAGPNSRIFGMDVGCGVDIDALQMAYGKAMIRKPVLGCGVVINGIPYHEIMPINKGERYNK